MKPQTLEPQEQITPLEETETRPAALPEWRTPVVTRISIQRTLASAGSPSDSTSSAQW